MASMTQGNTPCEKGLLFGNPHRCIRGVLFDMDGVLVDSIPVHIKSWNQLFNELGLPPLTNELYFSVLGHTNKEMLAAFCEVNHMSLPVAQISDILLRKERLFRENLEDQASTTPGVMVWLDFLKNARIPCAVASSGTMANIVFILNILAIADYFVSVISGIHFPFSKPDPRIFLSAVASLDVPAEECLVVEDAPSGIQAANSANMACIALATSYPESKLSGADLVLETLAEKSPKDVFNQN